MEEHLERLLNILTSALCEPLKTTTTVELRHDVLRQVIKKVLPLNTKIWLEEVDLDPRYFPRGWASSYVMKRGDQRSILFPVAVRLFLGRSRKLYCEDGREQHSDGLRNCPFLVSNKHIDGKIKNEKDFYIQSHKISQKLSQ